MKIVLDTETCGGFKTPIVYDLGWVVATDKGEVIKTRSYIIKEVYDNPKLFQTAYYSEKRPIYEMRLKSKYSKKVWLNYALRQLKLDMKKYGVEKFAYNSSFDNRAIKSTMEKYKKDKYNPLENAIVDIMDFIKPITNTEQYKKYCKDNGYMTNHKKPQPRRTAEILYRYLTGNNEFMEDHTALEDSKIELFILMTALKRLECQEEK